jgi:hypothetical protein
LGYAQRVQERYFGFGHRELLGDPRRKKCGLEKNDTYRLQLLSEPGGRLESILFSQGHRDAGSESPPP